MSKEFLTLQEVVSEIESGKYRDAYLVYNRRSTDDPNIQKNSIAYQKANNLAYAERNKLSIPSLTLEGFCRDGIVSERHSGFKEDDTMVFGADNTVQIRIERPKFFRLMDWLIRGYFAGVITLCWDRASRNGSDSNLIRKSMFRGVDFRFVLGDYDKTSAGELHMDIDSMFAQHHSRVTSEKVTLTMRNKRAQGIVTHRAPVGYLNLGGMEHKPIDPERAPIIQKLFEMYATSEWSLADLARWATEQGFTMSPMRRRRTEAEILAEEEDDIRLEIEKISRPPTYNSIHKILTNPFYKGLIPDENGVLIKSISHEPIVSAELFDRVKERLHKRNKSARYTQVLGHPLRRVITCSDCGRVYTPYPQKGIMYYGAKCYKDCPNPKKSFNFDFITAKVGGLIHNLSFTKKELEMLDARTNTEIALLETKRLNELERNERRKKKIREDLGYLNTNRLTLLQAGVYTAETYMTEHARLNNELATLNEAESASDTAMAKTVEEVVLLSELLKDLCFYYENALPNEKEEIITQIFSELSLSGDTLKYQCKNGFRALESRFVANCDPTGNRTPV